ncbi:MAG: MFS transporter [Thermoleophilia bacterium]
MDNGHHTAASAGEYRMRGEQRWILLAAILASSMVFIDGSALSVALPSLQADLGATGGELLWIINAYLLMLASLILVGGALGDKLGRRKTFMAGIALFMVASLACGLAPSSRFLIAFRLVQGAGGALMIPGSLAIIAAGFPDAARGRAYGVWLAATTLVTVSGPVLGGALADAGLWRGVFLINLPLALASLAILAVRVEESRDEEAPAGLDYAGALMAASGLGLMTYAFIGAPQSGFDDPRILSSLAGGALLLLLFITNELRSGQAMVPPRLFGSRTFTGANILTFLLYGALSAAMFFLALNLIQVQGYSSTSAGLAFTPFALVLAAASPFAGRVADRRGARAPLVAGSAITGLAMLLMGMVGQTPGAGDYWSTFFPAVLMLGLGMGVTVAPLTAAVMGAVPTHQAGIASGVNNAVSRLAAVMMIAILGSLFLFTYSGALDDRAGTLGLSRDDEEKVLDQAARLGEASVPEGLGPADTEAVQGVFRMAFLDSFRKLMFICAAMSWLGSLAAFLLVGKPDAAGPWRGKSQIIPANQGKKNGSCQ